MIEYDKALVRAHIVRRWVEPEYEAIDRWVSECDNAVWDYAGGAMAYRGRAYYSYILFDSKEDLLACKLTFPDVVIVGGSDD